MAMIYANSVAISAITPNILPLLRGGMPCSTKIFFSYTPLAGIGGYEYLPTYLPTFEFNQ